ncbi:hypothetical protein [Leifsonia sp. NPDC058230]|uniref:hypothetical protein n=1 Tax=Leifsonia sp. NPDC058230 TaxID=3346391 RepID=UPI0036DE57E0
MPESEGRRINTKAYLAVLASAAALVLLSACTAPVSTPEAGPNTGVPAPAATPSPLPPLSGVDCSALLSVDDVSTLLGSTVGTVDPNLAAAAGTLDGWLTNFAIQAAHGATCVWGQPGTEWTGIGGGETKPVFGLSVLPLAQAAWNSLRPRSATPGAAYVGGESLEGRCLGDSCSTNVLVGNWWLTADASSPSGAMTERAFHDAVQNAVTALAALPEPTAVSVHNAIVDACSTEAYASAVARSFEVPEAVFWAGEVGFGLQSAVRFTTASSGCSYESSLKPYFGMTWAVVIPDGKRLFGELAKLARQNPSVTEFGRTPNPESEYPWFELYALVGNDWVTVTAHAAPDAERHCRAFVEWLRATYA